MLICSTEGRKIADVMERVSNLAQRGSFGDAITLVHRLMSETDSDDVLLDRYLHYALKALERNEGTAEKYRVNIVFDSSDFSSPPVVSEYYPTFHGIFGALTKKTDYLHMNISSGSLFRAIGGFFIVDINQILGQSQLWEAIKLFAESSSFLIKDEDKTVRVTASHVPVKIILLGSGEMYEKLCDTDDRFLRLFKICAEFDYYMEADQTNIKGTICYLEKEAEIHALKPITDDGLCKLLRYGSWYAEMRNEITTKLSVLGDLLSEADYYAENRIDGPSVEKAVSERKYFNGITEYRINKEIKDGEMIVSLSGTKVGVVNGLAVMDRGLVGFGTPAVISVSVAPGNEGIVNIEHEAGLSGEIHDKGLLILEGYLRNKYAKSFPLSIYAGICFEQSYAEVDGDSASSSELIALLSAIGDLPVRQEIAVTGSVNQMGEIQPVGGINEKVTGFFEICRFTGLTGKQGVIIPSKNINSLILPDEVCEAVKSKMFHIYPVDNIDNCMEILVRSGEGVCSFNKIIEKKLRGLYEVSRNSS